MLGGELGVEAGSIHAYIIGEHGNSEIATWSAARVGGATLEDFSHPNKPNFSDILEQVRQAAPEIVRRKGYTSFAVASSVNRICTAILRDEKTILPVSTMTGGQYGIDGVYLSLPCVIGRNGVEKIVVLPLDDAERKGLRASAELLKQSLAELKN